MKLTIEKPSVETSDTFAERMFSIGDHGMVFEILRSKLYSNPIAAICREYASNGRDSHREAGKPNEPVQIQLPNSLDPNFKVKDIGVGISPERVENIFVKYGSSTKRDTNTLTGGFGLGSKVGFAYSDQFTVITNYDGTQYHYSCIIDETRVGKLITLSETPTKDPNATTITIPVKPADFHSFSEYTEIATRHWDPRPTITGDSRFAWNDITKVLQGTNWAIVSRSHYSYDKHIKLIIDGIEYPLDIEALRTYADCSLVDAIQGTLYLYFNNGDLTISANREQVQLDKPTQNKVKARLKETISEIKKSVLDKIEALPSLWEANIFFRTGLSASFYDTKFLGDLTWKGVALSRYDLNGGCKILNFTKGGRYGYSDKIVRRDAGFLRFEKNNELYVNDLPIKEPTANHVKKAFEDNKDLKTIQIICPTEKITIEKLNETINLDKLNPKLLSSIATATARKTSVAQKAKLTTFKFNGSFSRTTYDAIAEDKAKVKILCMLRKDLDWKDAVVGRSAIIKDGSRILDNWSFSNLQGAFQNVSFYGIDEKTDPERVKEEFSDLTPLDKFIQDEIIDNKSVDYVGVKFANNVRNVDYTQVAELKNYQKLIADPESPFLKRLEAHHTIQEMAKQSKGRLELYEMLNGSIDSKELGKYVKAHTELDLGVFNRDYQDRYPLLPNVGYCSVLSHIAQYVNLIDRDYKEKKEVAA